MRLNSNAVVTLIRGNSPFRASTMSNRIWSRIRPGLTINQIVEICGAEGVPLAGLRMNVQNIIRAAWLRGQIELAYRGVTLVRPNNTVDRVPTEISFGELQFGVEFEVILPAGTTSDDLARFISEAGIPCQSEGYNHLLRTNWKIVTDGSLSFRGVEIVSPVLRGEAGIEAASTVAKILEEKGCQINRSCGFHVHVGTRDFGLDFFKKLHAFYSMHEGIIDCLLPMSRRNNQYCQSNRMHDDAVKNATTMHQAIPMSRTRYLKLNLSAYWRHGTVEFRQHSGTTSSTKAVRWIHLCLRMVQYARSTNEVEVCSDLNGMLSLLGCTNEEKEYFASRKRTFEQRRAA